MDYFADAVHSVERLREIYELPEAAVREKEIDHIDAAAGALIGASSLVFVASSDASGRCDVSPRGGPPGFTAVLDEHYLAIPDATGNRRIDNLRNVLDTGRVGLMFVVLGRGQTLRVNGKAVVSARPDLLDRLTPVGKPPRSALVVQAEEVYAHCPKAFVRSGLWQPESWPRHSQLPTSAEVTHAHRGDPRLTVADVERRERESMLHRFE